MTPGKCASLTAPLLSTAADADGVLSVGVVCLYLNFL